MPGLLAFTASDVARLTGLSTRQLAYWDRTGFFTPTYVPDLPRRTFGRLYSFDDVVGLRTLAILRHRHGIPLQELRRVGEWLRGKHDAPWSAYGFAVVGGRVLIIEPGSGIAVEPRDAGQTHIAVALEPIAAEMQRAAEELRTRSPDQIGRIVRNRYLLHNAWTIAGTRIPTRAIWSFHEAGYPLRHILREYPTLRERDIRGAIRFEAERRKAS